jgi:hypothetical protein
MDQIAGAAVVGPALPQAADRAGRQLDGAEACGYFEYMLGSRWRMRSYIPE